MERLTTTDLQELSELCPGGLTQGVDLSKLSQWRIGGRADVILRPSCTSEVAALIRWFQSKSITPVVIGCTSNLLFADEGIRVPIMQISSRMAGMSISEQDVTAQAGVWVPELARRLMMAGCTGAEHICGIPGTLGGLIFMNGGSQRRNIGANIVEVKCVDATGHVRMRDAAECGFAYRTSVFQTTGEIVTSARLRFSKAPRDVIRREMLTILKERGQKFPRKLPNCGSVFKSNPAMYSEIGPPGAAIERLGFKGIREGDAEISTHHANFIVNTGRAKSSDVQKLIKRVSCAVQEKIGFKLDVEVYYVDPNGHMRPAGSA